MSGNCLDVRSGPTLPLEAGCTLLRAKALFVAPNSLEMKLDRESALDEARRPVKIRTGASLVAQWVRLRTPNAGGPGQGTRSHMHATTKSSHATTKEPTCCN